MSVIRTLAIFVLGLTLFCGFAHGDEWAPPQNNCFTEEQLNRFLAVSGEWGKINAHILQDLQDAQSDTGRIAAVRDINQKRDECLARYQMSRAEFDWMTQHVAAAWQAAQSLDDAQGKRTDETRQRMQEIDEHLADAKARLNLYESARKSGTRVMTPQDRDAAIKSAKSDADSARDQIKQHAIDAAAAELDAAHHEADARDAEDLALHPPSDISSNDRDDYIEGKKNEADADKESARDAWARVDESNKAGRDDRARLKAAVARIARPDIPDTDDERASVQADDENAVAAARADIKNLMRDRQELETVEASMKMSFEQIEKDVPPENIELLRKNSDRYRGLYQRMILGQATTEPVG